MSRGKNVHTCLICMLIRSYETDPRWYSDVVGFLCCQCDVLLLNRWNQMITSWIITITGWKPTTKPLGLIRCQDSVLVLLQRTKSLKVLSACCRSLDTQQGSCDASGSAAACWGLWSVHFGGSGTRHAAAVNCIWVSFRQYLLICCFYGFLYSDNSNSCIFVVFYFSIAR